ncbi:hypothetical protein [Nonomuraea sp. NPDC049400]|uniref:hypothetical protein n=1 Tax=Nonomuraea sp. NPDC049400 TaxID=3364352 RepID=UPI0037BBCD87
MGEHREGTRATYRSKWLRLRQAVIGTGCATGKPVKLSADTASRPYTNAELAALWAWAGGQPIAELSCGCKLLLALGRGCGLDSAEVIPLPAHDVPLPGNGVVVVAVRGPRVGGVPVRDPHGRGPDWGAQPLRHQ